jgi:hypothetical protein
MRATTAASQEVARDTTAKEPHPCDVGNFGEEMEVGR